MPTLHPNTMLVTKASAGTGKTYTLAAHYVALLMNKESYKSILAVTFTNKATAEMKERILTYLHAMATCPHLAATKGFMQRVREVSKQIGLKEYTDTEYSQYAQTVLPTILSDYDNMKVCTIDSFLQILLMGLAQSLGQMAGYGIDLDVNYAIETAVDEVLSVGVVEDEHIKQLVIHYINSSLAKDGKWDFRPTLISMTKEMFKENAQSKQERIIPTDLHPTYRTTLEQYKKDCQNRLENDPNFQAIRDAYQRILPYWDTLKAGKGGRNYNAFYTRVRDFLAFKAQKSDALKPLSSTDYDRFDKPADLPDLSDSEKTMLREQIGRIHNCSEQALKTYFRSHCRRVYIDDLLMVGYVLARIKYHLKENNTFLLSETANTLVKALHDNDADFILLKAGIRYKHIMLDEFQDTSQLQWCNFRKLIHEILGQGGSTLIVGDVKQSIYRWRNGDFEIMTHLDDAKVEKDIASYFQADSLKKNRRSKAHVVQFNQSTFEQLRQKEDALIQRIYDEKYTDISLPDFYWTQQDDTQQHIGHEGGYVGWKTYTPEKGAAEDTKKALLTAMFQNMEKVLSLGYQPKDLLILIRTKKDGKKILQAFDTIVLQDTIDRFPLLKRAGKIVSGDSFLLESSTAVQVIICALKGIAQSDSIAWKYVEENTSSSPKTLLSLVNKDMPLMDIVKQVVRYCLCVDGVYQGKELSYLNCFEDKLRDYIEKYGSNLMDFLSYWECKMHEEPIPAASGNALSMMTIHTAKGLESKNIFIPFCNWGLDADEHSKNRLWCEIDDLRVDNEKAFLPIDYKPVMVEAGFEREYKEEQLKQRIDNINLLYVALTRARDNLFISAYNPNPKNVGGLLQQLYQDEYQVGELQPCATPASVASQPLPEPFAFHQADVIEGTYVCTQDHICFKQSNLTREVLTKQGSSSALTNAEFGNLCHAVLERILVAEDASAAIQDYYLRGLIPDEATKKRIQSLIEPLLHNEQSRDWFNGSWTILREDTFLVPTGEGIQEKRMDRVMVRDKQAIVLDYKFVDALSAKNKQQVREYMGIMRQMGYSSVQGFLWDGFKAQLEEVYE